METKKDIEIEVMGVHNLFWESYANRDIDLRFSLCSEDVTFIGSGLHERALNKTEYKNINKEGAKQFPDPFQIEFLWTNLTMLNKDVACVESEVVWSQLINDEMSKELLRNTTLLKKDRNKWLVTHVHGSVPDYRLKDGDYMNNEQTIIRNRELERQVFKRTRDLNETLEELGKKNRELEIETALEKVRSSSLAMKEPGNMVEVCRVISDQLQSLGVNEIRNVQTAIINELKGAYLNYQYFTAYDKSVIEETEYNKHPKVFEFVQEIKRSENSTFNGSFEGEELNGFREYRKQDNQFPDPLLDEATSMHYYFYSIGQGGLGLSTYKPLNDDELEIFKRFHNVFTLAYRRFIDIELAIAQAREAKIEAAMEKVRAAAMSMMKPDELLNVCEVLFTEFQKLGFDEMRNAMINIHNDEKETFINYDYSDEIGRSINHLTYNIHPVIEKQIKQIRSANDAFSETSFIDKDLEEWKKFRNKIGEKDDPRINNIFALCYYFYSIGTGSIGISTFSPIGEEKLELLKRFRNVFSLSYQRYSDIALAETQAREAQIELALERVRARTMAMQNSNELVDTSTVLFLQLKNLGIESIRTGVATMDEVNETVEVWSTSGMSENFEKKIVGIVPANIHPMFTGIFNSWMKKELYFAYELNGDELKKYYRTLSSSLSYSYQKEFNEKEIIYTFFFPEGSLNVISLNALTEEECNLVIRFAKVFGLVYRRFLDLKLAEAQAREAQIELSLERVRARTMAMQRSEELKDVIRVVYEQFGHLNILVEHSGFIMDYKARDDMHIWLADQHEVPFQVTIPYFDSPHWNSFVEAKEKGVDFFANHLTFEEKNKFYKELFKLFPVPNEAKEYYFSCPGLAISTVLLENVGLYIENFSGIPYTDEENNTLMRFGKVFQQTYTRFLDLQKAEAQAREAQIEASLEKVRTVALSLKKSDEMLDIAEALYEQLLELGFTNIRNAIIDIHNDTNETFLDYDYSHDMGKTVTLMSYYDDPIIEKQVRQIESSSDAFFEIILQGQDLQDLIEMRLRNGENEDPRLRLIEQLTYNLYSFGNGAIGISNFGLLSDEQKIVLKRFRNVFAFAYKRYNDLVRAENQAREAQIETAIERVRSKAMAMYNTNDLSQTVRTFFRELRSLNVLPWRCGVGQINEETKTTFLTTTSNTINGESYEVSGTLQQEGHPVLDGIFEHWKMQKEYYPVLHGDDIRKYYEIIKPQISYPKYPLDAVQYGHFIFIKEGFVFAWTENKLSEGELGIFRRFASVLSLTYRRYLDLKEAEEQNRIIQADNERKTKELEEARQLQLSMLPKELPKLPNLDIAVYMKTATEVGGDYYDFNVDSNGTLTILIGDATGHGMMSGMMVSVMKSFFISNRANIELKHFFESSNNSIKDMNLGRLMMALMGVQIASHKLIATNAGMPSLIYFRNKSQKAGEFVSNNLPLGAMKGIKYSLKEIKYEKGDTLLLMSDGFAELKNKNNEQYGYHRIIEDFKSVVQKGTNEIVDYLKNSASEWSNGTEPDDDVTFVVIKVK